MRDHPRSRGDYATANYVVATGKGSSPLARGLQIMYGSISGIMGIIPARAGTTFARCRKTMWPRDHPRSRGDYFLS